MERIGLCVSALFLLSNGAVAVAETIGISRHLLPISEGQINDLSSGGERWAIGGDSLSMDGQSIDGFTLAEGDIVRITTRIASNAGLVIAGLSGGEEAFRGVLLDVRQQPDLSTVISSARVTLLDPDGSVVGEFCQPGLSPLDPHFPFNGIENIIAGQFVASNAEIELGGWTYEVTIDSDPNDALVNAIRHVSYAIDADSISVRPFTEVLMDIRPRNHSNKINLSSKGMISVAIITTSEFDATQVDPLSALFGSILNVRIDMGARESHRIGHIEDVDRDGDADLVLHFAVQETGFVCGSDQGLMRAKTFAGLRITALDLITTQCPRGGS